MAEITEAQLPFDLQLRFALFGLKCALGVTLAAPEIERAFRESDEDPVSAKEYLFHQSRHLVVSGRVDAYEPETIRLRVQGKRGVGELLRRVVEGAEYQVVRLRSFKESSSRPSP